MTESTLQEIAQGIEDTQDMARHRKSKSRFGVPPKKFKSYEIIQNSEFEAEKSLRKFFENTFKNPNDREEQKRLERYKEWVKTSLDDKYLDWNPEDFKSSYDKDVYRVSHTPSGLGTQHEGEENELLNKREAEDELGRLLDIHIHQWKVASPKFREEFGINISS